MAKSPAWQRKEGKDPKGGLNKNDEVIVPSVSWSTTYYPLSQYGLKLKFVDVDLETLNIDTNELENAISLKVSILIWLA